MNIRTTHQPRLEATIKTPAPRQWPYSVIFNANHEHTPHTTPAPPSPTPHMQLPAGHLQLTLKLKSYQNVIDNNNIQTNDTMSYPTNIKLNKRRFFQT